MTLLKIKEFGPVQQGCAENDGWIEIRKVTVFIGNQGSGKSAVAKLFSTLSWIEKAMVKGQIKPNELSTYNRFIKLLKYQRIDGYLSESTEIEYLGKAFHFHFHSRQLDIIKNDENSYRLPKIMYVSAERNFLSVVDRPDKLKILPSPLFTFLDEYDNARNIYSQGLSLPFGNAKFEYDNLNKIAHISSTGYKIRLSEASSGFQSTVPLYLVTKYLAESLLREEDPSIKTQSIEEQRKLAKKIDTIMKDPALSEVVRQEYLRQLSLSYKPSCFINIVEEPEQNLFPHSQQRILYSLMEFNNMQEGNKLIMTTHSPYLVNYLTLAVKADQVKKVIDTEDAKRKLNDIVPLPSTIDPSGLVIYEFNENEGIIKKLPEYKGLPSDENYLNSGLEFTNELFAQMQEIEKGWR